MLTMLRQQATGAAAARAPAALGGLAGAIGAPAAPTQTSFSNALMEALKSVSQSQEAAGALQKRYAAGAADTSLEQTMVAMQKSQVAFQAAVTVRNRLVSAYTDIMNMNV